MVVRRVVDVDFSISRPILDFVQYPRIINTDFYMTPNVWLSDELEGWKIRDHCWNRLIDQDNI
jgi:hypothetical protein